MARKQVSIQETIETNDEFEAFLINNADKLICLEVYSEFCGYCAAMSAAVRKAKLEIGQDRIVMAKAASDNIKALIRFKHKSEPVFLFISKGKQTRALFGANGIELCQIVEEELGLLAKEESTGEEMKRTEISEMLPEESEKLEVDLKLEEQSKLEAKKIQQITLAARKKRICERLSKSIPFYNYIMFWPHCHQAHYDLYEKWDAVNINVAAKDTFQLREEQLKEVLYMSDIDPNEACIHSLLTGEVLVVLFKMFETDNRNFVKLMRYSLYEEIPVPKEDAPPEKQVPPIPAFERYASVSKTKREVRRERYEAKLEKIRQEELEAERLAAERARLLREEKEEQERLEKQRKEEERMARIAAGLPEEPEPVPEPVPEEVPEEEEEGKEGEPGEAPPEEHHDVAVGEDGVPLEGDVEPGEGGEPVEEDQEPAVEEFRSDVSVEDEDYIPPGGLFIPGLYTPPNELAKSNGLTFFFPKLISTLSKIESEVLPPHVLVMFDIMKRQDVNDVVQLFPDEILQKGIFEGEEPYHMEHIAYSVKQYDKMPRIRRHKDRLALMVSRKRSLPLLQLAGLNPCFISSDIAAGEKDCLALFPVGYGDDFEDEESVQEVVEEEVPEFVVADAEPAPDEPAVEEEEDEDEG